MITSKQSYFVPVVVPGMDIPILVTEIGESYWSKGQAEGRRASDILALEFIVDGILSLKQGNEEFRIIQNEVMVLKRGGHHFYEAQSETLHKRYFGLTGNLAEILMAQLDNKICPVHVEFVGNTFHEIIVIAMSKPENFQQRLSEKAYSVLLELILSQQQAKGTGASIEGTILHALQCMQQNMHQELTMQEIARYCCVSAAHLHALFRSQLRISPIRYFHEQKVKVAQNFLRTTQLSCKEIANRLGFDDQLHFSRLFKNNCSLSPSQYRAKARLFL